MTASPKRVPTNRVHLGSPVADISTPGRYLRHRAAADEASRARRRALLRGRLIIVAVVTMFYFLIGRDLLAVAGAKKDAAAMNVRSDVHQVARSLSRLSPANQLASDQKIPRLGLTSVGTGPRAGDSNDIDSLLSERPVESYTRTGNPR